MPWALTRDFIRSKPRPTPDQALTFAQSVMGEQGIYRPNDLATCESALAALTDHAVDQSEIMAIEYLKYALEGDA